MSVNKGRHPQGNAKDYARSHLQPVRIVWLDKEPEIRDAVVAVELCSNCYVSGYIISTVTQDKMLEDMLNKLIGGDDTHQTVLSRIMRKKVCRLRLE
ncbi:MAG: hypothetical protein K2N63_05295 [Lachnospiraceae bacterium]|nr:hypothetical protein [Lachnospiraceae bacterium]